MTNETLSEEIARINATPIGTIEPGPDGRNRYVPAAEVRSLMPGVKWAEAFTKAQGQFQNIAKDRDVKAGAQYSFKYATLAAIMSVVRKPLADHGLAILQSPTVRLPTKDRAAAVEVETRIMHASGETLVASLTLPLAKVDAQGIGSAISYAKRYHLTALLGLASEDEVDVDDVTPRTAPPPPPSPPPAKEQASHVELGMALAAADSPVTLAAAAARVSRARGLTPAQLAELRALHAKRAAEFKTPAPKPEPREPGSEG